MDLLGPDIFSTLWMKEQVLHRERAHLKVPDWSLVWNELLTEKLPIVLSRLNEISVGCEKIVPVSESFWSNLKFLRTIDLTARLWGWNVRVNGMRSFAAFYWKPFFMTKRMILTSRAKIFSKHFRFESLNGLPQRVSSHLQIFFIKKCRHAINKLKFNRNTKFSNLSSEEWSALKSLKKNAKI